MKMTFLALALFFAAGSFAFAEPAVISIGGSSGLLLAHPFHPSEEIYSEQPAVDWDIDLAVRLYSKQRYGLMATVGFNRSERSFDASGGYSTYPAWVPYEDLNWSETRVRFGLRGSAELWRTSFWAGGGYMESNREYPTYILPPLYDSDMYERGVRAPFAEVGASIRLVRFVELYGRYEWFFTGPVENLSGDLIDYAAGTGLNAVPRSPDATEVQTLNLGLRFMLP